MKRLGFTAIAVAFCGALLSITTPAHAALTLTAGNSATTTPSVATSITGFQIVGNAASTTPVQLRATYGTLSMTTTAGLTFDGASSGSSVNFSGTVANINNALSTLKYSRASTGTDTLEISLVNKGEIFFTENNHLYKFVSGAFNWSAAKTAAENQTAYGSTGYLVTITSAEENDFVSDRLTGDGWIGAQDSGTEGTWKWMTGPEAGQTFWIGTSGGSAQNGMYEAWAGGEPNQAGEEDCAETYVSSGTWNDFPCNASLGYVVEFGADGNMPTVVAQNVSIVTADVPAVASLFPANGAITATSTANLVLTFTKAVTAHTGNIVIKKTSDNSTVATIDVAGGEVSGSGSTAITINPAAALPEGQTLYVSVPSTAFKDASNNYFNGFSDNSTWTFTTLDESSPIISSLTATSATTTASVTWVTNENASTRLWYSADTSYASSTSEVNTSSRVTSHTVSLSDLVSCTLYSYKAVSRDASGNTATSSGSTFTTTGCSGGGIPTAATTTAVSVSSVATTTLETDSRTLTVETPANFTASSSSVVIQIKSLDSTTVLGSIGKPISSLTSAASIVFNVTALINNTTELDSFDVPVTVTYEYTDADVLGLDEETLSMYHYKDGTWSELNDCSVDQAANTISCEAPHFSVFAIFGNPPSTSGPSGTTLQGRIRNLERSGNLAKANALRSEYGLTSVAMLPASTSSMVSVRDLELGMTGEDVRMLQRLLNGNGFVLNAAGAGSPGNETDYFGGRTQAAVRAYQEKHNIAPSIGYWGPRTRASMTASGVSGIWW